MNTSQDGSEIQSEPKTELHVWHVVLIFAALLMLAYHAVIFQDRTMLYSAKDEPSIMYNGAYQGNSEKTNRNSMRSTDPAAPAWEMEPWMALTSYVYGAEHSVPLWNQYSGCGAPYLANMQSQVLFPFQAPFLIAPGSWSHDAFLLLRLLLAGTFAFLVLRIYAPGGAALVGAASYMLAGYHLNFVAMPEVSVSIMLPLLMLGMEMVLQQPTACAAAVCVAGVSLTLLGGMPELAFVQCAFAGIYALVRLTFLPNWHQRYLTLGCLTAGCIGGLLVAAPQVFTFCEYMSHSASLHNSNLGAIEFISGLRADSDWVRGVMFYLWPGAFKVPCFGWSFCGTVAAVLAFMGFYFGIMLRSTGSGLAIEKAKLTRWAAWFFGTTIVLLLLKQFGCPIINWVGGLPVLRMILFDKYDQPVIAFCIAALVTIGTGAVLRRAVTPKSLIAAVASVLLLSIVLLCWYSGLIHIDSLDSHRSLLQSIYVSSCLLVATLVTVLGARYFPSKSAFCVVALLCLLCIDIQSGFLSRTYNADNLPLRTIDPYKGAPFITYLKNKVSDNERICGVTYALAPEWSAAFQLKDLRTLDGLYPLHYLPFIRNQLPEEVYDAAEGYEIWEWFFGSELAVNRMINDPRERVRSFHRLIALTSAKYIIAAKALPTETSISPAVQMHPWLLDKSCFKPCLIDGEKSQVLLQHPEADPRPGEAQFYTVVPSDATLFDFNVVRNPTGNGFLSKEGVYFNLDVITRGGHRQGVFTIFCHPSAQFAQRPEPHTVDLSRFAGQRVLLCFSVKCGPSGCLPVEWAGWHHTRWHAANGTAPAPVVPSGWEKLVYDKEVKIYEMGPILPRASLFHAVQIADNDQQDLAMLCSDSFDPLQSVVVDRRELDKLSADQRSQLMALTTLKMVPGSGGVPSPSVQSVYPSAMASSPPQFAPAQVLNSTSAKVSIDCPPQDSTSLLLLTDTVYPGWRAWVDGKESPIIEANYTFRAVLLPPRAHRVLFVYEPISYRLGLLVSFAALAIMLTFCALEYRNARRD